MLRTITFKSNKLSLEAVFGNDPKGFACNALVL